MKKMSLVSVSNAAILRDPAFRASAVSIRLFERKPTKRHKFKVGETLTLRGLEDFPEFNGTQVRITAIREDEERGRAYYVDGAINEYCNWVYEYRLTREGTA